MSNSKKGPFGVDWGAVGKLMGGLATGDTNAVAEALTDERPAAPPPGKHEPNSKGCDARDDGFHCAGHNDDGDCIMVKDGR